MHNPGRRVAATLAALVCSGLSGCSTMTPGVYSPRLASNEACSELASPGEQTAESNALQAAIKDTESARKRFIRKAACISSDRNLTAAALIGLSSLALFKATTSPHPKVLSGLGVLGGATYFWAGGENTSANESRQIYLAGAGAMSCALKAVELYQQPPFTRPPDESGQPTLAQLIRISRDAQTALRASTTNLELERLRVEQQIVDGRRAVSGCPASESLPACELPEAASPTQRALYDACQARKRLCTNGAASVRKVVAHASVHPMLEKLKAARTELEKLTTDASARSGQARLTPRLLSEQSARIQTTIDEAAGARVPDLKVVFTALATLRPSALTIAPAAKLADKPVEGATESSGGQTRTRAAPRQALEDATQSLAQAFDASTALRQALELVKAGVDATRSELSTCVPAGTPRPTDPAPIPMADAPAGTGVVTADVDPQRIAQLLGLDGSATGEQVQQAVARCQQRLGLADASGVRMDPVTLKALVDGSCRSNV